VYCYELTGGKLALFPVLTGRTEAGGEPRERAAAWEKDFDGIIVVPLFAAFQEEKIVPSGLDLVSFLRREKKNFKFSVLFLVLEDFFVRDKGKLKSRLPKYFKDLFVDHVEPGTIRELNHPRRSVLMAELIFPIPNDIRSMGTINLGIPSNIFYLSREGNLLDALAEKPAKVEKCLADLVERLGGANRIAGEPRNIIYHAREDFYCSFYEPFQWEEKPEVLQRMKELDVWLHETKKGGQTGVAGGKDHHAVAQLFRPPIPFFLWRFFLVYWEVAHFYLREDEVPHLLMFLLDNKDFADPGEKDNKIAGINEIFSRFCLWKPGEKKGFSVDQQVSLTANPSWKESFILDRQSFVPFFMEVVGAREIDFYHEQKTRSSSRAGLREREGKQNVGNDENNVKVVKKIFFSDYLVVFLDFFLSADKFFAAHDFIREYNHYKLEQDCFQTDWFFIVSAAHRDVLEYAQAGSLSSFSATTKVDFGDNPLLENRRFIFLYKLLQFLQSRVRRFNYSWRKIEGRFVSFEAKNSGLPTECKKCLAGSNGGGRENFMNEKAFPCLENSMEIIRQFLLACADENSALVEIGSFQDNYVIAQRLENILRDFLMRPEADWAMIQLQIDYLEKRFASRGLKFICSFIIERLRERSETY
jgi:hypothetical protein